MEEIVYRYLPEWDVVWSEELTRAHGHCILLEKVIEFSTWLDSTLYDDNIRTAYHEVAHGILWEKCRISDHGSAFIGMYKLLLLENHISLPVNRHNYIHASYSLMPEW